MTPQRPDRTEWRSKAEFAEVAEALDVPTASILVVKATGVIGRSPDLVVIYNESEDSHELSYVLLRRGSDEILRPTSPPILRPGLWGRIAARAIALDADRDVE